MSTRRKRIPRPARPPVLVAAFNAPEAENIERMALQGFLSGWAGISQYNTLADCRDLLALAANCKNDSKVMAVCELACIALQNIADRYKTKNRIGATGDELAALRVLVEVSQDWWKLQSGELLYKANKMLDIERESERKAA